ncbi:hypothetical protein BRD03_09115 [Halobacteriales archaeon QS_9_68_17]|nr:MAG: hypothetical protein BRD03_09115 [Halobacteriales archaeon QS_9_68_17]
MRARPVAKPSADGTVRDPSTFTFTAGGWLALILGLAHVSSDARPGSTGGRERWLTVAKLLLTVIVTLVGLMETLGLL